MYYVLACIIVLCPRCDVVSSQESVKFKMFERSPEAGALLGHVIHSPTVTSDLDCLVHCHQHQRCLSFNYKNTGGLLPVCQLSDQTKETRPDDLVALQKFYYYGPIKSPCLANPCQNGGTCQQEFNNPLITYQCMCTAGFNGQNCDILEIDSSSNFDINFPRRGTTDYVLLQKMPQLSNFTISFTVKLSKSGDHTFISYATPSLSNAIFIHQRGGKFNLWINNKRKIFDDFPTLSADNKWHHVIITWDNAQGKYQVYIDGKLVHSSSGFLISSVVHPSGKFVLGNDQDTYGGGFKSNDALYGTISRVNVWDMVLPQNSITKLLHSCGNEVGTAVAWKDFRPPTTSYHEKAKLQEPSLCTSSY